MFIIVLVMFSMAPCGLKSMVSMDRYLNGNYLTGSLPHELGLLSKLYWLDVAFNRLSGPLPFSSDGNTVKAGLDNLTTAQHL